MLAMKDRHRFNALKDEHAAATSEQLVPSPERGAAPSSVPSLAPELTNHEKIDLEIQKRREKNREAYERTPDDPATKRDYFSRERQLDNEQLMEHEKEERREQRLQRALNRTDRGGENDHAPDSREGLGRERDE